MPAVSLLVTADEVEAVTVSGEALLQLASRLNGTTFRSCASSVTKPLERKGNERNLGTPFVSVEDGVGFVDLLRDVVKHHATTIQTRDGPHTEEVLSMNNEEREAYHMKMEQSRIMTLRYVVLELRPELLATLLSILHAPHIMAEGDALSCLFHSVLMLLQTVLLTCCIPSEHIVGARRDAYTSIEVLELSGTTTDLLERLGAVNIVSDLLYEEFPLSVRLAATQLLFTMMLRDGSSGSIVEHMTGSHVRDTLSTPERLSIFLSVLTVTDTSTIQTKWSVVAGVYNTKSTSHNTTLNNTSMLSAATACAPEVSSLLLLRLHVGACLRELANTHFESLSRQDVLDVLLRLSDTEPSGDLRALSMELLNIVLLHSPPSFWATLRFKKEITALCVTQLGRENHHEALHATLSIVETIIMKDVTKDTSGNYEIDDFCVCQTLLALFADRALAKLIGETVSLIGGGTRRKKKASRSRSENRGPLFVKPKHTSDSSDQYSRLLHGSHHHHLKQDVSPDMATTNYSLNMGFLAAHCLRLLLQHVPYYRNGAFFLIQHFPSASYLLEASLRLAEHLESHSGDDASSGNINYNNSYSRVDEDKLNKHKAMSVDGTVLMLAVELSILMGLCFAQDPRARQLIASEFCNHHAEAQRVRCALISNLNFVSLSYFGGVKDGDVFKITDITGKQLNALNGVKWDTPDRPSRVDIHELFTAQELRWNNGVLHASQSHARSDGDQNKWIDHNGHSGDLKGYNNVDNILRGVDYQRHQRLTFIVLSYAIHYTFKFACADVPAAVMFSARLAGTVEETPSNIFVPKEHSYTNRSASSERVAMPAAVVSTKNPQRSRYYNAYLVDANKVGNDRGPPSRQQQRQRQQKELAVEAPLLSPTSRDPQGHRSRSRSRRRLSSVSPAAATSLGGDENSVNITSDVSGFTEEEARLIIKFQRSLRLFRELAQFYTEQPISTLGRTVIYETTGEKGMVRRQGRREAQTTIKKLLQEIQNASLQSNKEEAENEVKRQREGQFSPSRPTTGANTRSWSIKEVQEKDLFYFYIPYTQLTVGALEYTRRCALEHSRRMKKAIAITPQSARARRWMLHDILANIMPGTIHALSQFIHWFHIYGEYKVKFAVLLYFDGDDSEKQRDKIQQQQQQQLLHPTVEKDHGDVSSKAGLGLSLSILPQHIYRRENDSALSSLPRAEEVGLHAGNIISLLEQLAFYFQRRDQVHIHKGDLQLSEGQHTSASFPRDTIEDSLQKMYLSEGMSIERDTRMTVPMETTQNVSPSSLLPSTRKKSALLRDIERQIERLQKMEFCGDEDIIEDKEALPFSDMSPSPYKSSVLRTLSGGGDILEDDDCEDDNDEDEFDETKVL